MVVQLNLTEAMIASFNHCTRKGDYNPFVTENEKFIKTLCENLKKVHFDKDDVILSNVSGNLSFYLNYLTQYDPRDAYCVVRGVKLLERDTPTLIDSLKSSIATKDWSKFYSEYRPTADFMIKEARNQEIFDLQIEYGASSYDVFEVRDLVAQSQDINQYPPPTHQTASADVRNDKGMIRFEGEEADKHRAKQNFHTNYLQENHAIQHSSDNGVTNVRVKEEPPAVDHWHGNRNILSHERMRVPETHDGQSYKKTQSVPRRQESLLPDSRASPGYKEHTEPQCALPRRKSNVSSLGICLSQDKSPYTDYSQPTSRIGSNSYGCDYGNLVLQNTSTCRNPESRTTSPLQDPRRDKRPTEHHDSFEPSKFDKHPQSPHSSSSVRKIETPKEYVPAFSAEQELKLLRKSKSPEAHSAEYDPSQQISEYRNNMEKSSEIRPSHILENTSPRRDYSYRELSLCRDSPQLDNSAFDRELAEQKFKNALELEEKKRERKKKQKKFEEEFRKLKEESRKRFEMLLTCILAKHSFEIQEEKWMGWIRGCQQNLISLLNRCTDFVDDVERDQKGFRRPDMIEEQELQSCTIQFLNSIMSAYNILQFDFENLKNIEKTYPDALFVRVLMNSLEEHSQQTNEKLGKFNNALKLENDDSRSNMEKTLEEMIRKVVREEVAKEISKTINARKDVKDVQSQTEVELAVFEPPTTDSGVSRSASYESPHVSTLSLESLDLNQQIAVETIDEIPDQQEVPSGLDSSELPVIIEDSSLNDNFSQRLAEQNRFYEEKLRAMREKRVVKNKAAEEELRELGNRITRGASWRSSWHL